MNRNLKNEEVKKYITIGAVLIILYWALQNLQLIFSVMSKILTLFMPFLIGGVIAFIMNVPMKQIERHLFQKEQYQTEKFAALRRTCAYVLTLLAIIVILAAAMVIVIPQLVSTIADIVKLIPGQFQNVQQFLMEQAKAYPQIEQQLASVQIDWESLLKSAMDFVTAGTKGIISGGIGAVTSIVSGVTNFFIGFIFSIYVLFQKETLARQTKKILYAFTKEKTAQKVLRVVRLANTTFASFLSGQCLEACILGTMFCVTMLVIRLPYALLIGIVIAITALIPIVGAFIGCVVGIILIGLVNPVKAVIFVIMFFVLQQIEGNLIYPHVVGSSVGLPGMWVLMAVTVGGSLFGIVGMLTFIPFGVLCTVPVICQRKAERKEGNMTIIIQLVLLVIGFAALVKGADFFVEGSSAVAGKLKIPGVVIGLTIVAMGTSAPELAVSVSAAIAGSNEIAISNIIGSDIFNLVLIFAICAVITPVTVDRGIMKRDFPFSIIVSVILAVMIADYVFTGQKVFTADGILLSGTIGRLDAVILILLFIAYLAFTVLMALKNKVEDEEIAELPAWKCAVYILGGAAAIIIGGQLVVNSAKTIALACHMTETLVGLTIVAMGTSLPELVTSVVAAKKGQNGMAAGNIIGSNIFNILLILGVSAFIHPIPVITESLYDTVILIGLSIIIYIFAATGDKIERKEGIAMIGAYILYMIYAVSRGMGWI